MPDSKAKREWQAAHTVCVNLRLNDKTDADLIKAINGANSKAGKIKELARKGLAKN